MIWREIFVTKMERERGREKKEIAKTEEIRKIEEETYLSALKQSILKQFQKIIT